MEKTGRAAKQITDEAGRKKTLLCGKFAFIRLERENFNVLYSVPKKTAASDKKNILFLGLGADMEDILPYCQEKEQIFYLEHTDFSKQCGFIPPDSFQKISETEFFNLCAEDFLQETDILFYRQNLQLFPSFWNAILVGLHRSFLPPYPACKEPCIALSGNADDLLHKELIEAIREAGFLPLELGNKNLQEIFKVIETKKICLFLSVNGQALDANGIIYEYLKQKHIPLALWFVDNPWNILSAFSQNWWMDCPVFLTDLSFKEELEQAGAKQVFSLPLAGHSCSAPYIPVPEIPLFFVGNSSFANKNNYFSGCRLDRDFEQNLYRTIQISLAEQKALPDFHSIWQTLFPEENPWLNKNQRTASLAASKADLYLRKLWLENLSPLVHIMGDNAWQDILSAPHTYYKPVNYYTQLPSYYKNSLFTLSLTSLLMPANLSQRHFDVWKHDGFLLSSPSKGMNIFPSDIVSVISVQNPQDCLNRLELLLTDPKLKTEIKQTMQNEISRNHTYRHRLQRILELA